MRQPYETIIFFIGNCLKLNNYSRAKQEKPGERMGVLRIPRRRGPDGYCCLVGVEPYL
jgi:hypothetical protein